MHNVLIISYIAFSIGNLFILPESSRILEYFIGLAQFCRYKIRNSAEKAIFALQKTGGLFPISGARILVDNPVACDKSPPRRGFRGGSDLQMWPKAAGD